ncbi:hypothetical protein Tco_1042550 [Tanacetum coccineum]|uniref:Uncharacterized protein n=2 Tax=Tanacetum coccineum TaxID=301880 RepID=A0ABQ5GKS4_9ASTR
MENKVDVSALTMEQYIALILDDIKPDIVNPKIGDDIEFEINANYMRELRRKLFACINGEDAYKHVRTKVHIFYTGLDISTRKILDSNGFIPLMTPTQDLESIQVMEDHSHNWYDETTTRERINDVLDNVDAIHKRHLKEQMGSPYRTHETIRMIENPKEIHGAKVREEEGDMDVGWDIKSKVVESLSQFLTPTIHTLPNLEPVVQPYIPLGPVHDKDKIVREMEQNYDIPLNDSLMKLLTPQAVHITPPDDDYVASATNPMSNKQLNKFEEEFSHITEVAKKEYDNLVI